MYFDFDRCDFAEQDQATTAPALSDAQHQISWAGLLAATDAWQHRARAAGVLPGHALVISGHKAVSYTHLTLPTSDLV